MSDPSPGIQDPSEQPFFRFLFHLRWPLFLVLFAAGSYLGLQVMLGLFRFEPDAAHSLMVWHGVQQQGLPWLKDWLFTSDNWLLSLVPIHFAGYFLYGPAPALPIYGGWAIFVLSALVPGLLARELGARVAAFLLPVLLVCVGLYAHYSGYVSYSTTHNITNLFGLMSVLLMLRWAHSGQRFWLAAIAVLQITAGISDPWLLPAYTLPMLLVAIALQFRSPEPLMKRRARALFVVSFLCLVLIRSQFLGLLSFIPQLEFSLADPQVLANNALFLLKDLGGLFNLVPCAALGNTIYSLISLAAVTILCVTLLRQIPWKVTESGDRFFYGFLLFSCSGIAAAVLVSSEVADDGSARFLINVLYLLAAGIAVAVEKFWNHLGARTRTGALGVALLFLTAGLVSNLPFLNQHRSAVNDAGLARFTDFLSSERLNYGYGTYWGSGANAVTAISRNQVRIRPVFLDGPDGNLRFAQRAQTSSRWYDGSDASPDQTRFFVTLRLDNDECPVRADCISRLSQQFGRPQRVLDHENRLIVVWNHALIRDPEDIFLPLQEDWPVYFNKQHPMPAWQGWSAPEAGGIWSQGKIANVQLALPKELNHEVDLWIDGRGFVSEHHDLQEITVFANDEPVGTLQFTLDEPDRSHRLTLPASLVSRSGGRLLLRFEFQHAISPSELGLSADLRQLGLHLRSIKVSATSR